MEIGTFIAASVAGGLGAVLRWLIDVAVSRRTRSRFPWGVWLVNVLGSFVLGLVAGWLAAAPAGLEPFATIVGAGLLGGFLVGRSQPLSRMDGARWLQMAGRAPTPM